MHEVIGSGTLNDPIRPGGADQNLKEGERREFVYEVGEDGALLLADIVAIDQIR